MTDPKPVTFKHDGVAKIAIEPDGTQVISAKTLSSTMEKILSFGIENICEIRSYNIEQKEGKIFHHVIFHSGGAIDLSFNPDGTGFSASITGMKQRITDGERILVVGKNSKN